MSNHLLTMKFKNLLMTNAEQQQQQGSGLLLSDLSHPKWHAITTASE